MADHLQPHVADSDIRALLRELTADDHDLVAPPADVWAAIREELAADVHAEPSITADGRPDDPAEHDNVVSLAGWRSRSRMMLVAAAAAAVVIAGIVAVNLSDDPEVEIVASADLVYEAGNEAFDELGADAAAHVNLLRDDGELVIEIDDAALPTPTEEPADLEIWVIDDGEIVSLGLVDPVDLGAFEVPEGLALTGASLVDISIEPRDGDEGHSGRSILRAPLDFA